MAEVEVILIIDSPRNQKQRAISFSGYSSPSQRPLTSSGVKAGRRHSVTSVYQLSRSRQELLASPSSPGPASFRCHASSPGSAYFHSPAHSPGPASSPIISPTPRSQSSYAFDFNFHQGKRRTLPDIHTDTAQAQAPAQAQAQASGPAIKTATRRNSCNSAKTREQHTNDSNSISSKHTTSNVATTTTIYKLPSDRRSKTLFLTETGIQVNATATPERRYSSNSGNVDLFEEFQFLETNPDSKKSLSISLDFPPDTPRSPAAVIASSTTNNESGDNTKPSAMTNKNERRTSRSEVQSPTPKSSPPPATNNHKVPTRRNSKDNSSSTHHPTTHSTAHAETDHDLKKSPPTQAGRRKSVDSSSTSSSSPRARKISVVSMTPPAALEVSHNETVVYVHRDEEEDEDAAVINQYHDMTSAAATNEGGSMFERRKTRRASEPALGGHFLRSIQNMALGKDEQQTTSFRQLTQISQPHSGSPPPLLTSHDLTSAIVDEEEEDRYNAEMEQEQKAGEDKVDNHLNGEENSGTSQNPRSGERSVDTTSTTSTADSIHNDNVTMLSSPPSSSSASSSASKTATGRKSTSHNSTAEKTTLSSNGKSNDGKTKDQNRRKSEGDVMRFARVWRLHAGDVTAIREIMMEENTAEEGDTNSKSSKNEEIWDAVRKCRYIRGYNPPEMKEPSGIDVGEYVFGHPAAAVSPSPVAHHK